MSRKIQVIRTKKRSATRYTQFMDNFEEWVAYWRANPHRFITDYLQLKLYDFQQVLIYMMFFYPNFVFVASRGLKVIFKSVKYLQMVAELETIKIFGAKSVEISSRQYRGNFVDYERSQSTVEHRE